MAGKIFQKPTEPATFAKLNSPGHLGLLDVLHAWPAKIPTRAYPVQHVHKLNIQLRIMLSIYELAVRFFAYLDTIDRLTPRSEIFDFSSSIFRRVVEHGHGQHRG